MINPFVLLGLGAVAAGLIIELLMKDKQADEIVDDPPSDDPSDDPPVVIVEDDPNAEIRNRSASGLDDSPDSGDIPASEVSSNSGDRSINLDS